MSGAEQGSLLLAKEPAPKRVRSSSKKRKRKVEPQSSYGEITVRTIKGKQWIIVECGYVLEMHLLRSVFCAAYPPVHVSPHIDNVMVLRKILERYPMAVNTPKKWQDIQDKVDAEPGPGRAALVAGAPLAGPGHVLRRADGVPKDGPGLFRKDARRGAAGRRDGPGQDGPDAGLPVGAPRGHAGSGRGPPSSRWTTGQGRCAGSCGCRGPAASRRCRA